MIEGGENLGSMTIYVVDKGGPGDGPGGGSISSPGGGAMVRMPTQRIMVPDEGRELRRGPGVGRGFTASGVANVISQSTTNPAAAAASAVGMAAPSMAGPLIITGAAITAVIGAVVGARAAIVRLTERIGEIARFAPLTMRASVEENVASLRRQVFRANAGDADFSAFQRSLTKISNSLTPLVSVVERAGARVLTSILGVVQKLLENVAVIAAAAGAGLAHLPGTLGTIGQTLQTIAGQILKAQGMSGDPNQIFRDQVDMLTQGSTLQGYRPGGGATPVRPW